VWQLLVAVAPLGVAAAITPTLFALQVLVVSGPRWRSRAVAVALAAAMVFAAVFGLVLAGLSQLPDAGTGRHGRTEYVISLLVGAILVPLGIWLLRPHMHADAEMQRKVEGYAEHANPWVFFGIAAYMSATDFSSLLVMVPALHLVTSSAVAAASKAFVVLLLFLCIMLPVLLPPTAVLIGGDRAIARLRRVYDAVMGHQVQVMGVVAFVVGLALLWRGVRGL
jgi:hypothetical protein